MKTIYSLLAALMLACFAMPISAKDLTLADIEYDIEGAGVGQQGTYLVKVTVTCKEKNLPENVLAMAAVHGVLFRGFNNPEKRIRQKPLAGSAAAEAQGKDVFEPFFGKDGDYRNYANVAGNTRSVMKSGKKWKTSAVVSVAKDQLRHDLQEAGAIRGLNSGF